MGDIGDRHGRICEFRRREKRGGIRHHHALRRMDREQHIVPGGSILGGDQRLHGLPGEQLLPGEHLDGERYDPRVERVRRAIYIVRSEKFRRIRLL